MRWFLARLASNSKPTGWATRRRPLFFEELETRQMLAASALTMAAGVQPSVDPTPIGPTLPSGATTGTAAPTGPGSVSPTPVVSPSVVGAAVVLTSSVLTPTAAAPLAGSSITSSAAALNPAGSTQLGVILDFGQDALTATDVPDASQTSAISTSAVPWAPSLGLVTPLGQALGGVVTRTESLERGELGNLNPMGRASHGTLSPGAPGGENDQGSPRGNQGTRPEDDSFNSFSEWEWRVDPDADADADAANDTALRHLTAVDEDTPIVASRHAPKLDPGAARASFGSW
ncbi:MAG TPA: hypothetical protein VHD36_00120 [Pirellulales bacterium]|nr:hypothetical protein [Pirellulales bacterium]